MAQNRWILLSFTGGGILFLDQMSKFYVQKFLTLHESLPMIPSFFSLTYIRNPGAAFGLFANQSLAFRSIFFFSVSSVALVLLLLFFLQASGEDTFSLVGLSLLFGGAVGNLIDRVRFGEVVDFLDFYVGEFHWPAFNVADSAITVGASFLILSAMKKTLSGSRPQSL